jgi:transcriptional regulator with XRE-family HTH domain
MNESFKEFREGIELTQDELSQRIGYHSQSRISMWESGSMYPGPKHLSRLVLLCITRTGAMELILPYLDFIAHASPIAVLIKMYLKYPDNIDLLLSALRVIAELDELEEAFDEH